MNKLFTKIGVAFVGIAMAIGVGVAVSTKDNSAVASKAAEGDTVYTLNASSVSWDTSYNSYKDETAGYKWSTNMGNKNVSDGTTENRGIWLGANNSNKTKMILSNGSISECSAIATAIGVTASDTYYSAICQLSGGTALSNVKSAVVSFNATGGTAPSEAWMVYSTNNGSTWNVFDAKKTTITSPMTFTNTSTIPSALYGFVIHCTAYGQMKNVSIVFKEGSTAPSISFNDSALTLKTNNSAGVTKSVLAANVTGVEYLWYTSDENVTLLNEDTSTVTVKPNTESAGSATIQLLVTGSNIEDYENGFTVNLVLPTVYTITITANHCTYTGDSSIVESEEASISFTPDDGYNLPGEVTSVSGATVKTFVDGVLTIQNPTANVSITMTAAQFDNDVAHIVNGGKYKIHHTKKDTTSVYYLKSNGTTSAPSATLNSWEATVFTFIIVGDNEFEIKVGDDYLYTGNDNNALRIGPTRDSWVIGNDTQSKTGNYEFHSTTYTNRYLSLYSKQDFRCYSGADAGNRTENTDLTLYDSAEFAKDVVAATGTVCDGTFANAKTDFTTADPGQTAIWTYLTNLYATLPAAEKTVLVGATYTREDATVTPTGSTTQVIADGVARLDYLVAKYELNNILAGRIVPSLARVDLGFTTNTNSDSATLIIVVISLMSLTAIGGYFLIRRRKENN